MYEEGDIEYLVDTTSTGFDEWVKDRPWGGRTAFVFAYQGTLEEIAQKQAAAKDAVHACEENICGMGRNVR